MVENRVRQAFQGSYVFHRAISSPLIVYSGIARFSPLPGKRIRYFEEGTYRQGDISQYAYQERNIEFYEDHFLIFKSDGRLLHHFVYPSPQQQKSSLLRFSHTHVCRDDLYKGELLIHAEDEFSLNYEVTGPSKSYEIKTFYKKQ